MGVRAVEDAREGEDLRVFWGVCRRYPPRITNDRRLSRTKGVVRDNRPYPAIVSAEEDWCGEWQPRAEGE